jgi:Domain of Unknown Function (DUF748)
MLGRYKYLWALAIVAVVVLLTRAAAPSLVKGYVNHQLHALETYDGEVADVDLALWRGAYRVHGIRIVKEGAGQTTPFFSGRRVDFSVEWRSLLRGSLVAEGLFVEPNLNLVQTRDEQRSQLGKEVNWAERLEALSPFRFNTIKVEKGAITFRAPGIRTEDALEARRVQGAFSNITNVADSGKSTFAEFRVVAAVLGNGSVRLSGSVDPLARQPTFDVNLEVKNVQLPSVNPWLRQFIKADAESGDFEIFIELAAADGKFKGYAKPMMRNVSIYSSEEPERNPLKRLWEGIVDFAAEVLENDETGQVAARVPFSGTISNPDAGVFETIVSVLRNAFVSAFARSLEGSISLRDVKKNLKEIGGEQTRKNERRQEKNKNEEQSEPDLRPHHE